MPTFRNVRGIRGLRRAQAALSHPKGVIRGYCLVGPKKDPFREG